MVLSTQQALPAEASSPPVSRRAHAPSPSRRASWSAVQTRTDGLLRAAADADPAERARLRDSAVVLNLPVARSIAGRYRGRGEPLDDLVQAANVGLVKAVRCFDPFRGYDFLSYAVPVITGEVRRHFRDYAWAVRPPRSIQQLQQRIASAMPVLSQQLGHTPGAVEVAASLGVEEDEVLEALAADGCFTPASLDMRAANGEGASVGDVLLAEDHDAVAAEARTVVVPALRRLRPRDRRIVVLRFYGGLSQQEIAADVGISQMQVSRVLRKALDDLRPQVV